MTHKHYLAGETITNYIRENLVHETGEQRRLREETASHPKAIMQISPEQGAFLQFLVKACGVKRALEIGVFTGYSSLAMALALPHDGEITACDVSEEFTAVARRYWAAAGVEKKIDLRLAPAIETLGALLAEGRAGWYDFVFIDADKPSYDAYYEASLPLLRTGGVFMLDNMLYHGDVPDPQADNLNAKVLGELNRKIVNDPRVTASMVPMADGILLAVKL